MEAHYLGQVPAGSPERRARVRDFFAAGGFPTARREDWRFSGLDGLGKVAWTRLPSEPAAPPAWTEGFERRAILGDGVPLTPERDADGLSVSAAASDPAATPAPGPLDALGEGLSDCGFRVRLARGREAGPVLLYSRRSAGGSAMLHPRSLIEVEPGASLTVVEAHDGACADPGWTNAATVCRVGDNARLRYVRVELETGAIAHTGRVTFQLGRDARAHSTALSLTGGVSRTDAVALLAEAGAEIDLEGLFLGVGAAKADQHTLAVHEARHTTSRQLFKNVLADKSSAVFDGKVVVAHGAIGSDASQSNRNLLLSGDARVHTHPGLEIHADDVKCAHGAAIGKLDPDALFYLRSRGLGRLDSREMLVRAFAGELVDKIPEEPIRALAGAALARVRASLERAA